MTQDPVTVTYSLEEILGQISKKLDRQDEKFESFRDDVDNKLDSLQRDFNDKLDNLQKGVDDKFDNLQRYVDDKFDNLQKGVDDKFDSLQGKFDNLQDKFDNLQKEVVEIKIGQVRLESEIKGEIKTLESEVNGIGKRLDTQEFINRSVVVGFVLALAAGTFKLFFPSFPNWYQEECRI